MLDIGWSEVLVIAAVTLIAVGPREIPRVLRSVRGFIAKVRSFTNDFQSTMDEAARSADLEDLKKDILNDSPKIEGEKIINDIVGTDSVAALKEQAQEVVSQADTVSSTLKNSSLEEKS